MSLLFTARQMSKRWQVNDEAVEMWTLWRCTQLTWLKQQTGPKVLPYHMQIGQTLGLAAFREFRGAQ